MLVYGLVSCSALGSMFAFVRWGFFDLGEFFLFFGGSVGMVGVVEVVEMVV